MKFFFPDHQDYIDPSFDFNSECGEVNKVRQRDDLYAHEVFDPPPYDGLLVSKSAVDGYGEGRTRCSVPQRHRLRRVGANEFFRLQRPDRPALLLMGDCGAFSYVKQQDPPFTVDEVINFYEDHGFDFGLSVDHIVLSYSRDADKVVAQDARRRQALTLELAQAFLQRTRKGRVGFVPIGVVQGWSPASCASAAKDLQAMGYRYLAIGGLAFINTHEMLACLEAINEVRHPETILHMLGGIRFEALSWFQQLGVVSFDSASPLRHALKDAWDNYYTDGRTYSAIRIPQSGYHRGLRRRIGAGELSPEVVATLERQALSAMRAVDAGSLGLESGLDALGEYEALLGGRRDYRQAYRETLEARPWATCPCPICRSIGYHVILLRGSARSRRRGFHNLWIYHRQLAKRLTDVTEVPTSEKMLPGETA